MLESFEIHNLFWRGLAEFQTLDPQLSKLAQVRFTHRPYLLDAIPIQTPGIYIVTGGRQVGKTTLLKLLIKKLLVEENAHPQKVFYLPCDTIETFEHLLREIEAFEATLKPEDYFYLFIDEVTYVREWDRGIKALADRGFFDRGCAIISGSDTVLLKEAMMRFPGRRGMASQTDFHLHPLSFFELVSLYKPEWAKQFRDIRNEFQKTLKVPSEIEQFLPWVNTLYSLWHIYLNTGGYLTALNSYEAHQMILPAVYQTYTQWILGDMLKKGKKESFIRDIFQTVIAKLTSQITWNSLLSGVRIEHHHTIADYIYLLERMGVLFECPALREDKFKAAPKKARKIHFQDPFIFHAVHAWIQEEKNPFELAQKTLAEKDRWIGKIVENTMASLAHRIFPTYYIKAEKEVDLVVVSKKSFLPIEIKWTLSPHPSELKQLLKYKNGIVATKAYKIGKINGAEIIPVPLLALLMG